MLPFLLLLVVVFPLVAAAVVLDDFDNMAGLQLLAQLEALLLDAERVTWS